MYAGCQLFFACSVLDGALRWCSAFILSMRDVWGFCALINGERWMVSAAIQGM